MTQAAASDLANEFNENQYMSMFLFVMVSFGAASRMINGACCVNISHLTRIKFVAFFQFLSFIMIAFACMNKDIPMFFWVAVVSSIFSGISQCVGEAVMFGFLKGYPSYLVGDASTGTGFSGPIASGVLLLT